MKKIWLGMFRRTATGIVPLRPMHAAVANAGVRLVTIKVGMAYL
jgi:hypothetical protein